MIEVVVEAKKRMLHLLETTAPEHPAIDVLSMELMSLYKSLVPPMAVDQASNDIPN
jgi:hypothetical protein